MGSPPHTRGIQVDTSTITARKGITPAYAGNTLLSSVKSKPTEDHPRIRGEYGVPLVIAKNDRGSPPHTRGIPKTTSSVRIVFRITPAYAGNTTDRFRKFYLFWDYPRIRGEYCVWYIILWIYLGSPPHTRGIQVDTSTITARKGITPAYAGNTPHWHLQVGL